LTDPQGYVIKRLLANDSPPQEFVAFKLGDETWSLEAHRSPPSGSILDRSILKNYRIFVMGDIYGLNLLNKIFAFPTRKSIFSDGPLLQITD
jgi:hypothetical protein